MTFLMNFRSGRGKNDPHERRRIQNRLNQRAFRQRQRAGEPVRQYNRHSQTASSSPASQREHLQSSDDESDDSSSSSSSSPTKTLSPDPEPQSASTTRASRANCIPDPTSGLIWDELARLINRNLMDAAINNAQDLGINSAALQSGTPIYTQQPTHGRPLSPALVPVELQYQILHDPIIDTIPHPRLRFNILRAIAARQIDPTAFSQSVRNSGAFERSRETWQRGGLVVWSSADQISSWELSCPFIRRWAFLLQGCEDVIVGTNAWRTRRGENPFHLSLSQIR